MWLFKFLGLTVIFCVCGVGGILKAERLRCRAERLNEFIKALSRLAELIRIGNHEIFELCSLCFEEGLLNSENGKIVPLGECLEKGDCQIIEEFFGGFGIADTVAEQNRTELYINMLKREYSTAVELYKTNGGLYRSVGFMGGLILCIFFM